MAEKYEAPAELPRYPTLIRDAENAPISSVDDDDADVDRQFGTDGYDDNQGQSPHGHHALAPAPKFPSMADVSVPFAEARAKARAEEAATDTATQVRSDAQVEAKIAAANAAEAALPLKADDYDFHQRRVPAAGLLHPDEDEDVDDLEDEEVIQEDDNDDQDILDDDNPQPYSSLRDYSEPSPRTDAFSPHAADVFQRVDSDNVPYQNDALPEYQEELITSTRSHPSHDVDYIEEEVVEDYPEDDPYPHTHEQHTPIVAVVSHHDSVDDDNLPVPYGTQETVLDQPVSSSEHDLAASDLLDRRRSSSPYAPDSRVVRHGALVSSADGESTPVLTDHSIASGDASWIGGSRNLRPSTRTDLSHQSDSDLQDSHLGAGVVAVGGLGATGLAASQLLSDDTATKTPAYVPETETPDWVQNHANLLSSSGTTDLSPPVASVEYSDDKPYAEMIPERAPDSAVQPEWARQPAFTSRSPERVYDPSDATLAARRRLEEEETPDWVRNRPVLTPVSSIPVEHDKPVDVTFPNLSGPSATPGVYDSLGSGVYDSAPAVDLHAPSDDDLDRDSGAFVPNDRVDDVDHGFAPPPAYVAPDVPYPRNEVEPFATEDSGRDDVPRSSSITGMDATPPMAAVGSVPSYSSLQDGSGTPEPVIYDSVGSYGAMKPLSTHDSSMYVDQRQPDSYAQSPTTMTAAAPPMETRETSDRMSSPVAVALGGTGPLSAGEPHVSHHRYHQHPSTSASSFIPSTLYTKGVDLPSVAVVSGPNVVMPHDALMDDDADDYSPDSEIANRHSEMLAASSDVSATHVNVTRDFALVGGHAIGVNDAAFLNADTLVTAGQDGKVCIWDLRQRAVKSEFTPYEGAPVSMLHVVPCEHSPHDTLMTLSNSRQMRIWSVIGDRAVLLRTMQIPIAKNDLVMSVPVITPELMERAASSASIASAATASMTTASPVKAAPSPVLTDEHYPAATSPVLAEPYPEDEAALLEQKLPSVPFTEEPMPVRSSVEPPVHGGRKVLVPA